MSCLYFLSSLICLVEAPDLAVDADAAVALQPELLEQLLELALAAADDRRHHQEAGPLGQGHHPVGDLLDRLPLDRLTALGAVRLADPRPEQAQVVVDLGHRPDRRARVPRGGLLVDRDRRARALDRVDVRLLHQAQELAGVGGERLDVAPLALGVDRVEGKARLAGPGEAGHHDQRVARQLEVDVLEVVLARPADDYALGRRHKTILGAERTFPAAASGRRGRERRRAARRGPRRRTWSRARRRSAAVAAVQGHLHRHQAGGRVVAAVGALGTLRRRRLALGGSGWPGGRASLAGQLAEGAPRALELVARLGLGALADVGGLLLGALDDLRSPGARPPRSPRGPGRRPVSPDLRRCPWTER